MSGGPFVHRGNAYTEGHRIAAGPGSRPAEPSRRERTADVLAGHGYEPHIVEDEIVLGNCPFDALAREHTSLVCGLNVALIGGMLEGLGCAGLEACLDPQPGMCCVKTRRCG